MKSFLFSISIFCGLALWCQAQGQPNLSPQLTVPPKVLNANLRIKPDLNFNGEPQQVNKATKPRAVVVVVRNSGPVPASNFVVELTYYWRVDHESFTAQSLKRVQTVGSLAAGQQVGLEFVVPDDLIHRNAPYGSPNVSLSFKVDATGVVAEMSESNNSTSFSLPIIN